MWNAATQRDPSRPLAFLHIPKSGGIALGLAIAEALQVRSRIHGWDRSLLGGYAEFETWPPEQLSRVFMQAEAIPGDVEFLSGHLAASTIQSRYPDAQRLTLLREPCARLLSLWVFWRSQSDDLRAQFGSLAEWPFRARGPLSQFLDDPLISAQIDNVAARMLIWPHPLAPCEGFIAAADDDAVFDLALRRLRAFDFVDLYESAAAMGRLARWLGQPLHPRRENVTGPVAEAHRTSLQAELTPQARNLLRQRTRIDTRLWQAVAEQVLEGEDAETIRRRAQTGSEVRYAALLAGGPQAAAA